MSCRLEPLFTKIVVSRIEAKEKTEGGIYIPDVSQEKPSEGTVLAVGPGRKLDNGEMVPCTVKPGDHVLFKTYAGDDVSIDGEMLTILEEDQILAVVRPKESPREN